MIRGERNTTDIISDIREQEELQAVADLARADAIHMFNFGVRYSIEDWITDPENEYLYNPTTATWDDDIRDYATSYFGGAPGDAGDQFAWRAATHLSSILHTEQAFGNYTISLESDVSELQQILKGMFQKSVAEDTFFEVINCDAGSDDQIDFEECQNGSFYINLDVSLLTDEEYERLPQIRVESHTTGRVLKEPILPRGNLRIYVPLRVFRAIAAAQDFSKGRTGYSGDTFLGLNPEINEYKIGMCYSGYCSPSPNINSPGPTEYPGTCPFDPISTGDYPVVNFNLPDGSSYDAGNSGSMESGLRDFVSGEVGSHMTNIRNLIDSEMAGDPDYIPNDTINVDDVRVSATARDSHDIRVDGIPQELTAKCAKVEKMELVVKYTEYVDRYKVISDKTDRDQIYRVKVIDNAYDSFSTGSDPFICYSTESSCKPS